MLVLLNKFTESGTTYPIAINIRNLVEVTRKDDNSSWVKYWDGNQIRSGVVKETPEEVVSQTRV